MIYFFFHNKFAFGEYVHVHSTVVLGPSKANLSIILKFYLFLSQIRFYRHNVTTLTNKWTLNTLCTLQESCRHAAGQAEIQPLVGNQTSTREKINKMFFSKVHYFFCCWKLQQKQSLILKAFWGNFKIGGVTKKKKISSCKFFFFHIRSREKWN